MRFIKFASTFFCITLLVGTGCENKKKAAEAEAKIVKQAQEAQQQKQIAEIKAKLDLARVKVDLDQMYLCLSQLKSISPASDEFNQEFEKVQTAIPLLQKIRLAKADHDHEEVVNDSAQFLELFPDHPEARQALKESGLIFSYLQESLRLVDACFVKDSNGEVSFVSETTTNISEKDIEKSLYNLNQADELVSKATQLDPQFEPALKIKKSINDCRNTIAVLFCLPTVPLINMVANGYIEAFNKVYRVMQRNINSPYGDSPSEVWANGAETLMIEIKNSSKPAMEELEKAQHILSELKSPDLEQFSDAFQDSIAKLHKLEDATVSPAGNVNQYQVSVNDSVSALKESMSKLDLSVPDLNTFQANIAGFAQLMTEMILFKTPEKTKPVLEKYKGLII